MGSTAGGRIFRHRQPCQLGPVDEDLGSLEGQRGGCPDGLTGLGDEKLAALMGPVGDAHRIPEGDRTEGADDPSVDILGVAAGDFQAGAFVDHHAGAPQTQVGAVGQHPAFIGAVEGTHAEHFPRQVPVHRDQGGAVRVAAGHRRQPRPHPKLRHHSPRSVNSRAQRSSRAREFSAAWWAWE